MATASCTLLGSRGRTSSGSALASSYSTGTRYYFGQTGTGGSWLSPLIIKFQVPSYQGQASQLDFSLWGYKQGSNNKPTFRYAIATSDANSNMYTTRPSSSGSYYSMPSDPYIISQGTFTISWSGSSATKFSVSCPVNGLNSGGIYYLYIYPYSTTAAYGILYPTSDTSHVMSCSMTYISSYSVYYNSNSYFYVSNMPSTGTKYPNQTYYISTQKPKRDKYRFLGWGTVFDPNGTSTKVVYKPGDPYTANASITLYAVWEKDDGSCYICVDGEMKRYQPYVYTDGEWKRMIPNICTDGEFKTFS